MSVVYIRMSASPYRYRPEGTIGNEIISETIAKFMPFEVKHFIGLT